jgi:hypothetical protein
MKKRSEDSNGTRRFLLRATALGAGALVVGCSGTSDVVGSHDSDSGPPPGVAVIDGGAGLGVVDAGLQANDGGPVGLGVVDAGHPTNDSGSFGIFPPDGGGVGLGVVDAGHPTGDGGEVGLGVVDAGLQANDGGEVGLGVVDAAGGG